MSGFYVGVDGKARKVKGAYIGVDGVARKIKKGYIGDENGVARLCYSGDVFDPVFANNTWENVIAACQNNAVPDTWSVGDQLTMNIDGTDYAIDIIGKNHDDYSDGSGKAPLTFQLHDCYVKNYMMHNVLFNYWGNCDMKNNHLPTIKKLLPMEVQHALQKVNKSTSIGSTSKSIEVTEEDLFLLSEIELCGSLTYSVEGEGQQYDYYKNDESLLKNKDGRATSWWMRSPHGSSNNAFCNVYHDGTINYSFSYIEYGVSFAFCF